EMEQQPRWLIVVGVDRQPTASFASFLEPAEPLHAEARLAVPRGRANDDERGRWSVAHQARPGDQFTAMLGRTELGRNQHVRRPADYSQRNGAVDPSVAR